MSYIICLYHVGLAMMLHFQVGVATNFSPVNDPQNPDPYAACLHRDLKDSDVIIAHPTLPCQSRVWIYNVRTHRSVVARVGDRGPRRALIDLAPATTRALRANGAEPVIIWTEK